MGSLLSRSKPQDKQDESDSDSTTTAPSRENTPVDFPDDNKNRSPSSGTRGKWKAQLAKEEKQIEDSSMDEDEFHEMNFQTPNTPGGEDDESSDSKKKIKTEKRPKSAQVADTARVAHVDPPRSLPATTNREALKRSAKTFSVDFETPKRRRFDP